MKSTTAYREGADVVWGTATVTLSHRTTPGRRSTYVTLVSSLLLHACNAQDQRRSEDRPHGSAVEIIRLGSVTDTAVAFTNIGSVVVDSGGRVFVSEQAELRIRVYDSTGALRQKIGGPGDGPGEFRSIGPMGIVNGLLWVTDSRARRTTVFRLDGSLVRTHALPQSTVAIEGGGMIILRGHILRERWLFETTPITLPIRGNVPSRIPRLILDMSGRIVDTLGFLVLEPRTGPKLRIQAGYDVFLTSLADSPLHGFWADGQYIVGRRAPPGALTHAFTVTRLSRTLDTLFHKVYTYTPAPVDSTYRMYLANLTASRIPGESADWLFRSLNNADLPKWHVPVSRAFPSQDNGLWLRTSVETDASARWLVLAANGDVERQVALPGRTNILWATGDIVWAELRDDMNVPWLVKYRLVGGA